MKINAKNNIQVFAHLTTLQNTCRIAALILAFVSVFVWFFKILFF